MARPERVGTSQSTVTYRGLRDWLEQVEKLGELLKINGANYGKPYPPKGGARRMRPGTRTRIPGGSGWIVTTKKGKIRTIASSAPITDVTTLGID